MNPQRRVRTVRRITAVVVAVAAILVLIAMFVGLAILGMVVVPGLGVAVVAAIVWLVMVLVERRDAHRHAAQGRSW